MSVRRFYSRERCFRHANFVSITRIGPFLSNTLDDSSPVRMWATNLVWAARSCRVTQIKRSVTFERSIWLAIFHVNELIESIDFFLFLKNWTVGRCPNSTCIFISIRIIHCFFLLFSLVSNWSSVRIKPKSWWWRFERSCSHRGLEIIWLVDNLWIRLHFV